MKDTFVIRPALRGDAAVVSGFIRAIAEYEKLLEQVEGGPAEVERTLFDEEQAYALIAEENGCPVGFALYFFNYSTFKTKHGLWLEDIFVYPEYRSKGYGRALFCEVARIAHEKNCGRMEWTCLDWNRPSIEFYRSMGASPLSEWTTYRLEEAQLSRLDKR